MALDWLSEEAMRLVTAQIPSIGQLELFLLLAKDPKKEWSVEGVAEELRTSPSAALSWLRQFEAARLIEACGSEPRSFRFNSADIALMRVAQELAAAYGKYRMRMIDLIYSAESHGVRSLADAFKWRK